VGAADILLVDDDTDLRELLAELLGARGFKVDTARHGAEALDILRAGPLPLLILLDYMMPVLDGPGFLAARQTDPALAALPVFILTAMGDAAIGASAHLATRTFRKPLRIVDLVGAINSTLGDTVRLR
jgi:CheY-like chemotaxis protein